MSRKKSKKKTVKTKIKILKKEEVIKEEFVKKIAIKTFGKTVDRFSNYFLPIKESLIMADLRILFRTYLSLMFFSTFLTFVLTFIITFVFSIFLGLPSTFVGLGLFIIPSLFASITFFLIYTYPVSIMESRKRDIDANLPFAITHMSAIAESGAPPLTIFKILSMFKEYGEIAKEAGKIKRDVEVFGLDALSALRDRIQKTPSSKFKEILQGILTTLQSGGNIRSYLMEESKKSMFEYTVNKEKYNELLTVYADLYTSLLLAAPTIFIIVLSMLAALGGNIFNLTIEQVMNIGILSLMFLNMVFLTFLHITQPKM